MPRHNHNTQYKRQTRPAAAITRRSSHLPPCGVHTAGHKSDTKMFRILLILITGIAVGTVARRTPAAKVAEHGIQITVPALLFVFGAAVGADDTIIDNLGRYGWQAAVIAILGIAGSIVAARAAKRILRKGGER